MERLEKITARGTGVWGGRHYSVELATATTTWTDSRAQRTRSRTRSVVRCSFPAGSRSFESEAERTAFISESFSELSLENLDPPEEDVAPHLLDQVLGEELAAITFVRDYVQLSFDSPPLNLYVWPRLCGGASVLHRADSGSADALLALIGRRPVAVDELLDLGLVLDFEGGVRLAVPLDGTDAAGPEVAWFGGDSGGVWDAGDPPFDGR